MKNSIAVKIKISIFLFVISLIYFSAINFLVGGGWFTFAIGPPLFYSFFLVFIYPYIKIDSQSLVKRSLFFGLFVWIIGFAPWILMNFRQILVTFDPGAIPAIILELLIKDLLYFIILGFIISFSYKKFLPVEFNLPIQKLKIPLLKTIPLIILFAIIYFALTFSAEIIILKMVKAAAEITPPYGKPLIYSLLFINPLIYSFIFTLVYFATLGRMNISRVKKWIIFTLLMAFFTEPLILAGKEFFSHFYVSGMLLFIPHFISILIIGYILSRFDKKVFENPV